jgi:hypothetical protein
MQHQAEQDFIQAKAIQNQRDPAAAKILWSRHAVAAIIDDELDRITVEVALSQCEVIEVYPQVHRPLPDCLVLTMLSANKPLHAVIAIDKSSDRIFIVTVYIPTKDKWQDDWRTRKR